MAKHAPRKLAVILHADVVGSTALVQRNESLAHERIRDVFLRFSGAIKSYAGTTHELRGDALVAEFNRASDAVEAALAFQASNGDFNAALDDDLRPELRVGISLGEVVIADNTLTGEGVVLAQRLEQLAIPGGVCLQGAVYEAVPGRLPFEYESLGEQALKGFTEPVRAYAVKLKSGETIPPPELRERPRRQWVLGAAITLIVIVVGGLAWTYEVDSFFGWSDAPASSLDLALDHAQKAVELDNAEAGAHWVMAVVLADTGKQPQVALAEFDQALSLNPNNADLLASYGWTLPLLGRAEEGVEAIGKAMRLNPIHPDWYGHGLMFALYNAKRYQEVVAVADTLKVRHVNTYLVLAGSHAQLGQLDDAQESASKALEIRPDFSLSGWRETLNFENPADLEHYFNGLRKAGLPESPPLALPEKPSIAVLPFTNMSGDPEQEYFADGMTDDLITDLSKISGLFVIARNSSFTYKGKAVDVKSVGRELGVKYVLEGSVRRAGDEVRINAQLIDASTGGHRWAERYDGSLDNVFALQDEVTGQIVAALAVSLTADEERRRERKETDDPAAYDAFLEGWTHYQRQTKDDFAKAVGHLEAAILLDPDYARAHAALAAVYAEAWWNWWVQGGLGIGNTVARELAKQHLKAAMKDPTPLAHRIASLLLLIEHEFDGAISEAERAIALDPNDPNGHDAMAMALILSGKPAEALDFIDNARRLDPRADYLLRIGQVQFHLERYDQAATTLLSMTKRSRDNPRPFIYLAAAYGHLGRLAEARSAFEMVDEIFRNRVRGGRFRLEQLDLLGFSERAATAPLLEGLRKAGFGAPPEVIEASAEGITLSKPAHGKLGEIYKAAAEHCKKHGKQASVISSSFPTYVFRCH